MTEYKSVKEQLLEYYMAQDHTEWTNTVIKVLSCEDPEIEKAPEVFEELNVIVAIPRYQNLNVEIDEDVSDNIDPAQAESSAQGGSYRSGTSRFQRVNVPDDYTPERKYAVDILDVDCVDTKERRHLKGLNDEPKEMSQQDKPKFCPQKKKTCKCWICQQIGHMSYEWPNTNSKAQTKAFEEIFLEEALEQYNLAPLETFSDVSSDEELFYLESDSELEIEYDNSTTSTDTSDQE
ncbi:hypothetical protein POTOM_032110 [Populus tomentosa]|uniref:Uncharacterized protein n=1 Tax=Populus tomentosa TaxID=118781 RepID=A0A8X8CIY3_POPTO|nr:hypothetical protein POTOM_032110 [Populus tomentosa]